MSGNRTVFEKNKCPPVLLRMSGSCIALVTNKRFIYNVKLRGFNVKQVVEWLCRFPAVRGLQDWVLHWSLYHSDFFLFSSLTNSESKQSLGLVRVRMGLGLGLGLELELRARVRVGLEVTFRVRVRVMVRIKVRLGVCTEKWLPARINVPAGHFNTFWNVIGCWSISHGKKKNKEQKCNKRLILNKNLSEVLSNKKIPNKYTWYQNIEKASFVFIPPNHNLRWLDTVCWNGKCIFWTGK